MKPLPKPAIDAGHIAGCALDVFEVEPPPADYPLFGLDKTSSSPRTSAPPPPKPRKTSASKSPSRSRTSSSPARSATRSTCRTSTPHALESVGPYLDLADALGKLLSKLAPAQCDSLRVSYLGPLAKNSTPTSSPARSSPATSQPRRPRRPGEPGQRPGHRQAQLGLNVTESTINARHQLQRAASRSQPSRAMKSARVAGTFYRQARRASSTSPATTWKPTSTGTFLFVENDDRPGIVGALGTSLGNAGQSTSPTWLLSRTKIARRALTVIEVDRTASADLLDDIRAIPGVLRHRRQL